MIAAKFVMVLGSYWNWGPVGGKQENIGYPLNNNLTTKTPTSNRKPSQDLLFEPDDEEDCN